MGVSATFSDLYKYLVESAVRVAWEFVKLERQSESEGERPQSL